MVIVGKKVFPSGAMLFQTVPTFGKLLLDFVLLSF